MGIDCVCIGLDSFAIPSDYVFSNVDERQDERLTLSRTVLAASVSLLSPSFHSFNQTEHETRRIFCLANLNKLRKSYLSKK